MKRGEIYFANLDPVMGSEQGGSRPVLIIQNDLGNRFSPTVIVIPLTGRTGKAPLRTHVNVTPPMGGLLKPSVILCEQVRTLEKSRLKRFIGTLRSEKMLQVEKALRIALGEEVDKPALSSYNEQESFIQEDKSIHEGNCHQGKDEGDPSPFPAIHQ